MVMNTRFVSQANRQRRSEPGQILQPNPNLGIQNNPLPPPFPPPDSGDQDRIAAMEAHIEALTRQNAELLLRNMEQPHPKVNRDGHEEEERIAISMAKVTKKRIVGRTITRKTIFKE
jgi:hypothetical protein